MPSTKFSKSAEVARAQSYPPDGDFSAWWEVLKAHVPKRADMDQSARTAVLRVAEKVKEAEEGPAGRRMSIIEAQWWFCQEVSVGLEKQGAVDWRFHHVVTLPEPHRRTRQYATLYRLERAARFERADDIAAVVSAGWDAAAAAAEPPRDDARVMLPVLAGDAAAGADAAGAPTRRELRAVLEGVVVPCVSLAVGSLALDHRPARELDLTAGLLWLRGAMMDDDDDADDDAAAADHLIDAPPAPFPPAPQPERQPSGSWETWDDSDE